MSRPKPNPFKYVLRTDTVRMEYDGSLTEGIEMALWNVKGKERREALLAKLQEIHVKMSQHEEEQPNEA